MKILIPDSILGRNVLAATRSLGRKGYKITIAQTRQRKGDISGSFAPMLRRLYKTRYCSKVVFIASPFDGLDEYVGDVLQLIKSEKYDVVMPFTHACVASLCHAKDKIEEFSHLPFGEFDKFMIFHDKHNTIQLAKELEVPVPESHFPRDYNELEEIANTLDYPVVVKASIGCGVKQGVRYAKNKETLLKGYSEIISNDSFWFLDDYRTPFVQEYIPGKIHDVAIIADHGEIKGALTQVRQIMYPIFGGTGSVNVTTNEPELLDLARRMLESVSWHGPAQAEFKLDYRDNTYKLLEVNPKFWGTLDLSIKAGIDFAEIACQIALSEDVKPRFEYKVGLTYRWIMQDELFSVAQYPNKRIAMTKFLGRFFKKNTKYDISFTDIVPDVIRLMGSLFLIATRKILPSGDNLELLYPPLKDKNKERSPLR